MMTGLATMQLVPLAMPAMQREHLEFFKTGFCERTTSTSWAKKFDDIKGEFLSARLLKTGSVLQFQDYTQFSGNIASESLTPFIKLQH